MRNEAVDYIKYFIGTWYKWGGDDPSGFDCSGVACEMLKSVGLIDRDSDHTAHSLYKLFKQKEVASAEKGCLLFWANKFDPKKETKVVHVEIAISDRQSIGASGGGSKTLTVEDAIRDNAFIKIRPFRKNIFAIVDPFI